MNDKELLKYYEQVNKEILSLEIILVIKKISLVLTEALLEIDTKELLKKGDKK